MDLKLKGKRALVTGSSSGIGAGIAKKLAAEGVTVAIHGRDVTRAQKVADEIRESGGEAIVTVGDLSTESGTSAVVAEINKVFGGIDILVNNVGATEAVGRESWFETPIGDWLADYQINVLASVRMIQSFVPAMKNRRWGRVIQISSRNAISPYSAFPSYGAAKAALNNLTLGLSKELTGTGITVNGVMPGLIYTPMLDPWLLATAKKHANSSDPAEGRDYVLKHVIKQSVDRLGTPDDIAFAVCYIASPLNDFMTGTTYRVDGGSTPTV